MVFEQKGFLIKKVVRIEDDTVCIGMIRLGKLIALFKKTKSNGAIRVLIKSRKKLSIVSI
ncbi:hypothetical protein LKF67_2266 [Lactococcus lactis subsp. lactis]|nr:hypothetical protein LKF67_2266 [Lactococcus lactis subsp. lactis]